MYRSLLIVFVIACDAGTTARREADVIADAATDTADVETDSVDSDVTSSEVAADAASVPMPLGLDAPTLANWDYAKAFVLCHALATCGPNSPIMSSGTPPLTSHEGCLIWAGAFPSDLFTSDAGYHLDPTGAARCLNAVLDQCSLPYLLTECAEVIDGPLSIGAFCIDDNDCAGDAYCPYATTPCLAKCRARLGLGEVCNDTAMCSQASAVPRLCRPGERNRQVCTDYPTHVVPIGAACGDALDARRVCGDDAYCTDRDADQRVCQPRVALGESCDVVDYREACVASLICGRDERCVVPRIDSVGGADCSDPEVLCDYLDGVLCLEGTCTKLGDGSEGALCAPGYGPIGCGRGLTCDDGTCQPRPVLVRRPPTCP